MNSDNNYGVVRNPDGTIRFEYRRSVRGEYLVRLPGYHHWVRYQAYRFQHRYLLVQEQELIFS